MGLIPPLESEEARAVGDYAAAVASGRVLLTDGATGTRLRLETALPLDPVLDIADLAANDRAWALRAVAAEYRAIAHECGFAIELDAATYWASPDHLHEHDRLHGPGRSPHLRALNEACVAALAPLRDDRTFVAGVVGPRADGYRPTESMTAAESARYHAPQVDALAETDTDLLLASTMSTVAEAEGVAAAMSATGRPYVVAFVIDEEAALPDGTSLVEAVARVDTLDQPPLHYLVSCTHPATALVAMRRLRAQGFELSERLIGIKANGSSASAEEREGAEAVLTDEPVAWSRHVVALHQEFGWRVLGGCCGTDGRHILALATALASG